MAENLTEIVQILLTDGVGPVTFYKAVEQTGSIAAAAAQIGEKKKLCSCARAEDEIAAAHRFGAQIITYQDEIYPENLRQLVDAPPILYAYGQLELLAHPLGVAIVGARNASIAGRKTASQIAYDLTERDALVVSGMARGIDCAAHKGAMYAKERRGPTIAVLGTGVDGIYPLENSEVYHQIAQQGLLLSELPMGTNAQVSNFPRRNRIISALCAGTLVVEASLHSGSLITAKQALEQGREVFAVPGSPLESRAAGPNQLIKQGAILTENADDILNVLSISQQRQIKNYQWSLKALDKGKNNVNIARQTEPVISAAEEKPTVTLLELISYEGVDIDELLRSSGLAQADFFMQILDLEFGGKIERQAGNRVARIK